MQLKNQAVKSTTTENFNGNLCLPSFSTTKIVTRTCHLDDSTESNDAMILNRYLFMTLEIDIDLSENIIERGVVTYAG